MSDNSTGENVSDALALLGALENEVQATAQAPAQRTQPQPPPAPKSSTPIVTETIEKKAETIDIIEQPRACLLLVVVVVVVVNSAMCLPFVVKPGPFPVPAYDEPPDSSYQMVGQAELYGHEGPSYSSNSYMRGECFMRVYFTLDSPSQL